ncbi:MAG: cupin-like domain-containing protein [Deltaproteobacteria bacterium]|nr:cupin-like domain-containing protein [Deltaproteobacteria bacterium]
MLLDGLMADWPNRKWSLAGLRERFGDRLISAIPTTNGRLNSDIRTGVQFEAIRFADYVDQIERGERPDYYLAAPGDVWVPELKQEIRTPEYCRDAPWQNSRLWVSAPDTSAPLHRDVAENIFFQLVGRKRFFLYAPAASPWLYSNGFRSALPNYTQFDPETPDYDRFPLSRHVEPIEVILEPGDAIYLPSRWWHQVRSLDISVSFNFWWAQGLLAPIVKAAEFVKRTRGLEIYGLEAKLRASGKLGGR